MTSMGNDAETSYKHIPRTHNHDAPTIKKTSTRSRAIRWFLGAAVILLFATTFHPITTLYQSCARLIQDTRLDRAKDSASTNFNWSSITPTDNLVWHACYEPPFECARLQVPLVYSTSTEPSSSTTHAALAIVKYPASTLAPRYLGPIIINPGGPGDSGVEKVLTQGKVLQKITGEGHDLIGVDPRGVENTVPKVSCFPDTPGNIERDTWSLTQGATGEVLTSKPSERGELGRKMARAKLLGTVCANAMESVGGLDEFSTPVVARDLLSITEALGEKKMKYWGFSYGSIIGMTFATLFPDRIDRMLVDGIGDGSDYFNVNWSQSIWDADSIVQWFFTQCHENQPRCAFAKNSSSPAEIEQRFRSLAAHLTVEPLLVPRVGYPEELVTKRDVLRMMWRSLYWPFKLFEELSEMLAIIEDGNAEAYVAKHKPPLVQCPSCSNPKHDTAVYAAGPRTDFSPRTVMEAAFAILCSDGEMSEARKNIEGFASYLELLESQSEWAAGFWAEITLGCIGWKGKSRIKFNGNLTATTSFPLLFIGNTHDPSTPLRNAVKMVKEFKDAALLVQDSYGHTTASAPSLCTAKHIRAYFQDGKLPPKDTTCSPDRTPFAPRNETEFLALSNEDQELLDLMEASFS